MSAIMEAIREDVLYVVGRESVVFRDYIIRCLLLQGMCVAGEG